MLDVEALSEMMAGLIGEEVERAIAPLNARIAELETREPVAGEKGEPGEPGAPADPLVINEMVAAEVGKAFAALPMPKDGENGKDAAGIVEALKDNGELVLTLQDGRLIRTGIRDGVDGLSPEVTSDEDWAESLSLEEKTGLVSSMLRKELGDEDLIILPDPVSVAPISQTQPPVVVHNHLPKRGIEKTVVTKHDERGRILEFERREA
jgi:hypothetical protein